MSLYDRWILPRLLDLAMSQRQLGPYRAGLVAQAEGRVLEIGIGSGLNLPFYGPGVELIIGLDPSEPLLSTAGKRARAAGREVALMRASAAAIPLAEASVDFARHDLDALFDPRPLGRSRRDAPRAAAGWKAAFRRAWALARSRRPALAAQAHAFVAAHRRRLPSRSQDRRTGPRRWLRDPGARGRLCTRSAPVHLHVRWPGMLRRPGKGPRSRSPAEPEACNARGSGGDTRAPRALPPRTRP